MLVTRSRSPSLALAAAFAPAAARHAAGTRVAPSGPGSARRWGSCPAWAAEIASGTNIPVVYHGGQVMRNVTVHTIFWAPAGYHFDGSPAAGVPGYEALVKQFLVDAAHDSAAPNNIFSTLTQYHDAQGAGSTRSPMTRRSTRSTSPTRTRRRPPVRLSRRASPPA